MNSNVSTGRPGRLPRPAQPRYHFIGIGGSGMMPLALLVAATGIPVSGSDRWFDKNSGDARIQVFKRAGVVIFPQTGAGTQGAGPSRLPGGGQSQGAVVVVSTAIEPSNPDLAGAVKVMHRSEILVEVIEAIESNERIGATPTAAAGGGSSVRAGSSQEAGPYAGVSQPSCGARQTILVAGSSGKTTTAAMIGWILYRCGLDPLVYVGAGVEEMAPCGARVGAGHLSWAVVEVDESDGSIERFTPSIAVVTSVSEDHKPLAEIQRLFREFSAKASHTVLSEQSSCLVDMIDDDIRPHVTIARSGGRRTNLLGSFNRINEALALEAASLVGIDRIRAEEALASFPGVARRLEIVASRNGRYVIDDFAHNPEKIEGALDALRDLDLPMMILFQPHGYGPTRMHHAAWGAAFSALSSRDQLVLLPIFDAGGTAERNISSADILRSFTGTGNCTVMTREEALQAARIFLVEPDPAVVVVMGARDPSLADLARRIAMTLDGGARPR